MRDLIAQLLENSRRSGDRVGVDGPLDEPATPGAEITRLARLATSIHLAESARLAAGSDPAADRLSSVRDCLR